MQFNTSNMLLREVNCEVLNQLAENDPRIIVMDSDLMNASALSNFQKNNPTRFVNCGIQEANMVGVAGGLSSMGMIPVIHSFAAFAGRRVVDQVFMSGVYAKQNIKIIGTDPGACNAGNGGTHMALEDVGIMRSMPGICIVDPTDETMLRSILPDVVHTYGVFYIRLFRKTKVKVYEDGTKFTIGKAHIARNGSDITIIASGALMVPEALKAAEQLEADGYSARVIDMFTIKPLDTEAVITSAQETGAILTAENHNILNGLGSAVAEVLAENKLAVPFARIGFNDTFGETGDLEFIKEKYGIDAAQIYKRAKELILSK